VEDLAPPLVADDGVVLATLAAMLATVVRK
jgi:hypothetical protein